MLGYLLWHQPADPAQSAKYEELLSRFHQALAESAPEGFRGSAAFALEPGYLDWYNVADFTALGMLNDAAVEGARKTPHDAVAGRTGTGTGGLYRLISGRPDLGAAAVVTWLSKPAGMKYPDFLEQASSWVDPASMGFWQRQLTLGPGQEFCLLGRMRVEAPAAFRPLAANLRAVWR